MTQNPAGRLAILGAGSWGTALCLALASRFSEVTLWSHNRQRVCELDTTRENRTYLPGFTLPDNIRVSDEIAQALKAAEFVLVVVPSKHLRATLTLAAPFIADQIVVSATKGIDQYTLERMSQIIATMLPGGNIAVLSGPTFAREVAAGEPAAVVVASDNPSAAEQVQRAFATPTLRLYASDDVVGTELGAALKNVIAIGAGICKGLELGSNTVAALITRGLAEITRLAVAMGGKPRTLSGLAGLGDLVLTATGDLSRNRYVGLQLGKGKTLNQILCGMTMVAEGVSTCGAARQLAALYGIEMPITSHMHDVLYEGKDPRQAIRELMYRPLTTE